MKTIEIKIPKGFMNCGIGVDDNKFVADTNNSSNWDSLEFPLPYGKWSIYSYKSNGTIVILKSNE